MKKITHLLKPLNLGWGNITKCGLNRNIYRFKWSGLLKYVNCKNCMRG